MNISWMELAKFASAARLGKSIADLRVVPQPCDTQSVILGSFLCHQ